KGYTYSPHPGTRGIAGNFSDRPCVDSGAHKFLGGVSLLMTRSLTVRVGLSLAAFSLFALRGNAQTILPFDKIQNQADLDKTITALDKQLFDAYNTCDLETFAKLIDENVEFYHDQGGITLGRAALTESVKKNICGKTTRELLPATLQVFYMKGIGAIEMGIHRFHHPGHEDTEGVGEGRFIHLWQYKDGAWRITRVMSYDHHAAPK